MSDREYISSSKSGGDVYRRETEPEISTIRVEFEDGLLKGKSEEFKVTFQFGNTVSVVVPSSRKDLLGYLQPGAGLHRMGFYSSMASFSGKGTVTTMTTIKHGPRKGDYLFDIIMDEE